MNAMTRLALLSAVGLLAGCSTAGRPFREILAEADTHRISPSVRVEALPAALPAASREKLLGNWECVYQIDVLDFRPLLPSPCASVLRYREIVTFMDDGVYFLRRYQDGKMLPDVEGLWRYEDGVLTLEIKGETRREYEIIWRGDGLWEKRWYPEAAVVDWWQSFYEREHPDYVSMTSGGYRPDGCLYLRHEQRKAGSGYIVDSLNTPQLYRRTDKGANE